MSERYYHDIELGPCEESLSSVFDSGLLENYSSCTPNRQMRFVSQRMHYKQSCEIPIAPPSSNDKPVSWELLDYVPESTFQKLFNATPEQSSELLTAYEWSIRCNVILPAFMESLPLMDRDTFYRLLVQDANC